MTVHNGHPEAKGPRENWHTQRPEEIRKRLDVSEHGLDSDEASRRLREYGPNRLPEPDRTPAIKRFLLQFHNVLIYILLIAAVGTAIMQHWIDTGVIIGVVVINAIIGFIQEGKAEEALNAIRDMLSPKAVVLRDGRRQTIDAGDLVPGDIVILHAGDRVPADLRLSEARNLSIDEAVLTGESVAVEKGLEVVAADADLGDRFDMAFSGTLVAYGSGRGIVIATGAGTEIGRISTLLQEVEELTTPLLQQVAQFGRWLSAGILGLAAVTFAVGYWLRDYSLADTFLAAVSLAVAAIPEGLPAIMTITLAIGVQRMAARNAIIRRLPAVETLGSITTICSDKTGTLTRNEMTVKAVVTAGREYEVSGVGYEPHGGFSYRDEDVEPEDDPVLALALRGALLCNDAELQERDGLWKLEGNPTEGALVTAAYKAGMQGHLLREEMPRRDVIPFSSTHKFMVTLHHDHEGNVFMFQKGAPERILAVCDSQRTADGDVALDKDWWEERIERIAERGQRLLAIAVRKTDRDKNEVGFGDVEGGMTLLALFGLIDPPRDEAIRAVAICREAGIRVHMITGDHVVTARAIGRELGIGDGEKALNGHQLEAMDDEQLREVVRTTEIFARTTPEHKLRLVKAIQANGHVVAMTGDGVNDAPALKRADVGIAMGQKGTEAAKEASQMVLADDNFASIANAIEEGRTVYDNLRKAILFMLPTNGGQAFTIVTAIMLGMTLPVTPVQALWINMVVAVTLALALAFEPTEPGVMQRRPRPPNTPILTGFLAWRIAIVSVLLVAGTFGHYLWMESRGASTEVARTVAINTLVVGQAFYLFNSRYILEPAFNPTGIFGSRPVLIAVGALLVLQLLFTYAPFMQTLFGTAGIGLDAWARILTFGLLVFVLIELEKLSLRRTRGRDPTTA